MCIVIGVTKGTIGVKHVTLRAWHVLKFQGQLQ